MIMWDLLHRRFTANLKQAFARKFRIKFLHYSVPAAAA